MISSSRMQSDFSNELFGFIALSSINKPFFSHREIIFFAARIFHSPKGNFRAHGAAALADGTWKGDKN